MSNRETEESDIRRLAILLCERDGGEDPKSYEVKAAKVLVEMREIKTAAESNSIGGGAEENPILADNDDYIDLCVGVSGWRNSGDRWIVEDDYRVAGEVWRVHKGDADPFPSNPHAHCVGGAKRFIGCTLHLGTAQLYNGRSPLGRFLNPKQFDRLIELIRPKFPNIVLPLP